MAALLSRQQSLATPAFRAPHDIAGDQGGGAGAGRGCDCAGGR